MNIKQHVQTLLKHLSQGLYEKDHVLALALLCAISGESLFLLGPPGTAKSEISRRLKLIFRNATAFEYLMSRFSTPDEIFGPISVQKLKSEDTYERKVEGFLPSATVVFLDEIWKAGPAIQNALLTVINEKIYQNGTHTLQVPMKCLIAASNELPAEDEGLEALWDRFLVRVVSNCIENEKTFYKMLLMSQMPPITIPEEQLISEEQLEQWQQEIQSIAIPETILKAITAMRKGLRDAAKMEDADPLDYYISDRRWRKNIQLLRTSAFLNGRSAVDWSDLLLLIHCLWNKVYCIEHILKIVPHSILADIADIAKEIDTECEKQMKKKAVESSEIDTLPFKKFHFFYLSLKDYPMGKCFFCERDYKLIPTQGDCPAVRYYDDNLKAYIIRKYDKNLNAFQTSGGSNITRVKLSKYNGSLLVDGTPYQFIRDYSVEMPSPAPSNELFATECPMLTTRVEEAIETLQNRMEEIKQASNLFISKNDIRLVTSQASELNNKLKVVLAKAKNL